RIEVLRGAASAQYGADAMGGAINVVTKGATQPLGGRIEAGSFGTVAGTIGVGFRVGHVRMAAGGALNRSDGYREGTDYDVRQLQLKLESPLAAGNVAAQLSHSRKNFGAADFYAPFPSYEETRTTRFAAWWRGSLGRDVELEPRLWVRRHNDDFVLHRDDPTRYTNSHLSSQLGAEAVVRYRVGDGFDLAFGGLAGRDLLESSNLGDRSQNRWAVYGEAVTEIGSATLNAGLRGDGYQDYGFVLSPSVSAAVWLSQLRFRGSFAGSFRTPTWTERYYEDPYNRGQPDLEPERGWTTEVGADLWMTDDMSLNLTAFSRRSRDLIDWARSSTVDDTSVWQTTNVKSATFYGLEGGLSGVVAATRVSLQASATSLTSDNDPGLVSKYALRPLVRELILQLGRDLGPARANLSSRYRRRQYEDGYWLLDVRMGLPFQFGEIYLDLLNALGVEYRRINGVLAPGRSFMLGFRYLGSM
ncbi:MAG: TonB-dependent receptor, partial [Gemmatimonadota bacterium]